MQMAGRLGEEPSMCRRRAQLVGDVQIQPSPSHQAGTMGQQLLQRRPAPRGAPYVRDDVLEHHVEGDAPSRDHTQRSGRDDGLRQRSQVVEGVRSHWAPRRMRLATFRGNEEFPSALPPDQGGGGTGKDPPPHPCVEQPGCLTRHSLLSPSRHVRRIAILWNPLRQCTREYRLSSSPKMDDSLAWPLPGRLPPARIRTRPEDFRVVERLAFEPNGMGTHLYVRFRKCGLSTPEAVRRIAAALGVEARDAGWAGLKDRHAVTEQWASFHGASPERAEALSLRDIEVLQISRHPRKLRTGRLLANRFDIRLRGEVADRTHTTRLQARWDSLLREGIPNYFGRQRFGRRGDNAARALAWLRGQVPPPRNRFERKMLPSALQSALFNRLLAHRVRHGSHGQLLPGDIALLTATPGRRPRLHRCDDPSEAPERATPSGPLYGPRMPWAEGLPGQWERDILEEESISIHDFQCFGRLARGGRRALHVTLEDPFLAWEEGAVRIGFTLPPGSYATVVITALLGSEPLDASAVAGSAQDC